MGTAERTAQGDKRGETEEQESEQSPSQRGGTSKDNK